jgi:hypothetical protein
LIIVQADFLSPNCNGDLTVTFGATNEADDFSQGVCLNSTTHQTTTQWSDNVGMGGTWSGPGIGGGSSAVPEPPGALLLGTALALMGIVVIMRKRALPFRAFTPPRSAESQNVNLLTT